MPENTGLAFIVVQHMSPNQKALLAEILQRCTKMPVHEAQQSMSIKANCVYVIPPGKDLSVSENHLELSDPTEEHGLRLPINVLFSSLASARNEKSIGVIMSGMGADGTLGIQAIHAVGGLTASQSPDDAEFDAMPSSAIETGNVDVVADAQSLPSRIVNYISSRKHPQLDETTTSLDDIFKWLRRHTHHDFSQYKRSSVCRRLERRMCIHELMNFSEYAHFLKGNTQELDLLFKELLIGVTEFFRDESVWQYLAEDTLPSILAEHNGSDFRIWIVGCSTGEEAYSIAMLFHEVINAANNYKRMSLQIFASDLSQDAIAIARRGRYPLTLESKISADRLEQFFIRHDDCYQIKPYIRDSVLFAEHDVILDPPFTKLDMLLCRNLLIYFDQKLQQKLLPLFHYCLNKNGVLVLGKAETVGRLENLFTPLHSNFRVYQKTDEHHNRPSFFLNKSSLSTASKKESRVSPDQNNNIQEKNLQNAADNVLLQQFSPAAVLLNQDADIVYISGRTGKYLEPAAGKASWNFHAMVQSALHKPLFEAINQANNQFEPIQLHDLSIPAGNDCKQYLDVTVQKLTAPESLKGLIMVVFREKQLSSNDASDDKQKAKDASNASSTERYYLDEIASLREAARSSQEELNEVNQSSQLVHEELQSANEELTTSKEEMQSMNEELQTINSELQSKLDDLALAQSDMQNVLNSTDIAILFLDQKLNVRRYTDRASKLINLRESDKGRPLSDLTSQLQYPSLLDDAANTLKTLAISEKQIATTDGRWFSVRIMPYRRLDNVIDGVVLTLVDISEKLNPKSDST